MWVICISLTLTNTYVYLYSQILYASSACRYSDSLTTYNVSTTVERMIQYCVWVYPVLFVFWPQDRTWYGGQIASAYGVRPSPQSQTYTAKGGLLSTDTSPEQQ